MDGIKLATLFSYMPNKLKYCGPKDASTIFQNYLKNNIGQEKAKELLIKFEALYPYLEIIAEKNSKDPFCYEVVESYWLGNELADLDKQAAIKLIGMLTKRGLLESTAKDLIQKIKGLDEKEIPLTHLFNVMFVGVGAVTGSVPTIIENMDKCRVSYDTICEINDSYLIVEHNRLKNDNGKYFISETAEKIKVSYDKNLLKDLNIREVVAVHWGSAVKKLNSKELNNLRNYTQKVIELISKP
ncbi:MAG: hypothetical protein ISS23_00925 [Nanoarchaeota archaeon]|nr:hypothetical protein [Nanoarchaeota archaeon]